MNKNAGLIILLAVAIIAVITNPKAEDHKIAVKEKVNQHLQAELSKDGFEESDDNFTTAGKSIGMFLGTALIDKFVESAITSDSYVLFSLTKATWKGESKIIGVGLFGNVILSEKVDEAFKQKDN